ncbi:MAG: hypothetical protein HY320_09730 [Armatimonadetes bacterium]|nr:hypothetical protein [Armatimonadota bacterium]
MPRRSSSPRDLNELAARIVQKATTEPTPTEEAPDQDQEPQPGGKNPAAVALGRLGGKVGGKARAAKLSADERKAIAERAARARWGRSAE